jgi:hypothetical protein
MSVPFTINFRREAYQREMARTRRRLFLLGGWVTYFGVLVLVLGLYGLNCGSLVRRTQAVERAVARANANPATVPDFRLQGADLVTVENFRENPARWRDRLVRLAAVLPANAAITSIAVNPDNLPNAADQNLLVIAGELRVTPGQDRMRPVVQLVSTLRADSLFSRGYTSIRLASSRAIEAPSLATEFVIECR